MTPKPKLLAPQRHAVFRFASNLLLVFKPRGLRETPHAHAYRQRLRVLSGALQVRMSARSITLRPRDRPLTVPAGRLHTTLAVRDTWLVAETIPRRPARRPHLFAHGVSR